MDIFISDALANPTALHNATGLSPRRESLKLADAGDVMVVDLTAAHEYSANHFPLVQWVYWVQPTQFEDIDQWMHLPMSGLLVSPDARQWSRIASKLKKRARAIKAWRRQHLESLRSVTSLTQKEFSILLGSMTYDVATELAEHTNTSPRTIEAHRYNTAKKLNFGSFRDIMTHYRLLSSDAAEIQLDAITILKSIRAGEANI